MGVALHSHDRTPNLIITNLINVVPRESNSLVSRKIIIDARPYRTIFGFGGMFAQPRDRRAQTFRAFASVRLSLTFSGSANEEYILSIDSRRGVRCLFMQHAGAGRSLVL